MKLPKSLMYFVEERERIRVKHDAGRPFPWTDDAILRAYKFCNIERQHDRVTREIAALYRQPHHKDPNLWFALVVARRGCNWPDTLAELGYPVPWDPAKFKSVIRGRQAAGLKAFEAQAYKLMVSGKSGDQVDLIADHVLTPLWNDREHYQPRQWERLREFTARLAAAPYMGGFYAGQVVADLKYTYPLNVAPDFMEFAVSGPGSRRGLDRVMGREPRKYWSETEWYKEFREFHEAIKARVLDAIGICLDGQDAQSVLCEYDKYCRLLNGEGARSVRRYTPPVGRAA